VDDCPPDPRNVCGTDGNTYKNKCHLDVTSCKKQMLIEATNKLGTCGKILRNGSRNAFTWFDLCCSESLSNSTIVSNITQRRLF
jgi:hypothetical protein